MRMFGKVLLLALVCVAATEVREINPQCQTEEALRQAATIFRLLSNAIYGTVETYTNGYMEFYRTCETYWETVWDFANVELYEVKIASLELTEIAKQENSTEEVFACISERTQLANEVLRVIPWTFDKRLQREADKYFNEHQKIVDVAYQYMNTYKDYYWNTIVKGLKECESNECLEEIVNNYRDEYEEISRVLAEVVKKLDVNSEQFKLLAETMLSAVRGTFKFARIAGVDDIKKCIPLTRY